MSATVQIIRWFNRTCPWHQPKPSIIKRAEGLIDASPGVRVYDGVQGRLRMQLDLSSDYEREIYLNAYELTIVDVFRRVLRPGDVMVDGGANIGLLSLLASTLVGPGGRVYAFEPQPRAIERLRENVRLNGASNVEMVERGCWSEPGTATLYEFEDGKIDGLSMGRRSDQAVGREMTIETGRIDAFVKPPVRLIKLDVEGAEWAAIKGCEKLLDADTPPHLIVELKTITANAFDYEPIEIVDWLHDRGLRYRMHYLLRRRRRSVTRDEVARLLRDEPNKTHNVWFEPEMPKRRNAETPK